jgi:aryl-alcohol dehydrogenase-like predicted oxidoreductase
MKVIQFRLFTPLWDLGLNWIDTAALYGLGHSEEVVSQALRGRRPRPYVFTKCERVWDASGTIGACLKGRVDSEGV